MSLRSHPDGFSSATSMDKRQWALEISGNSVYGSYGSRDSPYLQQFVPGAESTAAVGRDFMERAREAISQHVG